MSDLMSAIPGLSKHLAVAPADPAPAANTFDRDRAARLMRDAISLLNSFYPAGALEWLQKNRPDVSTHLTESIAEIDSAVLAEDLAAVTDKLDRFVKLHRRAFELFEQRPPVIEMQGMLL